MGDKITYKVSTSLESEVGLYKTEDDYGDAYIYRDDVTNNNVLFGGYYWKIIRTNGDNSIRLIYSGQTANETGTATAINNGRDTYSNIYPKNNSPLKARFQDPTYVGYMLGKNFQLQTSESTRTQIETLTKYYFADGYEFDEVNEVFKLKKVNLEPLTGTFIEMQDKYGTYPYTCMSTNENGVCELLLKVSSLVDEKRANVQFISYSSIDKDSTRTNELSSNAKIQLENWYETNFVEKRDGNGVLITDYIADGTFCNDRSTSQSGYILAQNTFYGAYTRLTASNKVASLKCSTDIRDKFSNTTSKGNGLLEYPVALITADEVALAGGLSDIKNEFECAKYQWANQDYCQDNDYQHVQIDQIGIIWQQVYSWRLDTCNDIYWIRHYGNNRLNIFFFVGQRNDIKVKIDWFLGNVPTLAPEFRP